ncbi:transcriptional regulator [Planotetraspora thailandica]|uniref:Transcriptional regulator n=1 Tax=Planotetraspora thailandica TaxID=487172 RepID=A0A8J3UYX9_9ACTN|nr:LysR family transcriptional regulator [Planotetraspora thailandica]GII54107.1 transcriptional regulator [Planotetraspora thailandica]
MNRPELALQQLHAFAVLAEELHFGRAAERLGIAQPPLSQQIRRLEQKVGHPLFTRGPGQVALTSAGHELLPSARRALDEVAHGLDAARRAGDGEAGRIRVGFSASLALTVLPALLRSYRERHPNVDMEITEMTTAAQTAALKDHVIDVGLLRDPAPDEPGTVSEPILSEEFVAILPAAHPLATLRVVPLGALAGETFVLLPRAAGPGLHDRIVDMCREAGYEPRIGQRAVEWQTVCALVEAGLGVSLAPAGIRRIRLKGVACRRIEPDSARTVVAVSRRRDDAGPLVAQFIDAVRERHGPVEGP